MGGNEITHFNEEAFATNPGEMVTINFPTTPTTLPLEEVPVAAANTVKIDYTAISIPPPKKTMNVKRAAHRTRVVNLEEAFAQDKEAPAASVKADEVSPVFEKILATLEVLGQNTQAGQKQSATIVAALEQQSTILPRIEALQKHLDQSHKVETANQRLFDAMHEELKGYKDNFLLESLQKPVIRDLVTLFDDLQGQRNRISKFLEGPSEESASDTPWKEELEASRDNLSNTAFFIIEVLNRLDVTLMESGNAALDLKQHKVVGIETTHRVEEKNEIARVIRPGFSWRERVLRPTEVIVKRYSPEPPAAPADSE